MRKILLAGLACIAACDPSSTGTDRVSVEQNELGIETVVIEHAPQLTTLRGLDANGAEVAGATLRTGDVMFTPDPDLAPAQMTRGREVTVWLRDERMPPLTLRGSELVTLPDVWGQPLAAFMHLDPVVRLLAADAQVVFTERSTVERPYTGGTCNSDYYPTQKGTVAMCCQEDGINWAVKTTGGPLLWRGIGAACSGGPPNCTGTDCVFGPCGSYVYWTGPATPGHVFYPDSSSVCGRDAGNTNWEPEEYVSQQLYPSVNPTCPYNWCCEGMPITGTSCGCGDGACEPSENPCSCPQDCTSDTCGTCGGYCNESSDCTGPGGFCSNNQCNCFT